MLKLCAAELALRRSASRKPIWVDIGGGTGWNIEQMDKYYGIANFEHVYLVDLCKPLCEIAMQRFKAKGWSNVSVVCQDAASFKLDGIPDSGDGQIDMVTLSYSLSMIETFYAVIDRISRLLCPDTGFVGVADFYVSDKTRAAHSAGSLGYQCSWLTRVFWKNWFELDHVYLHPARRNYLEHRLETVKVYNGRNHFIVPYFIQIPYYIWLGRLQQGENRGQIAITTEPSMPGNISNGDSSWLRLAYEPSRPEHAQFSTYIYGFTWEDPQRDIEVLDLSSGDRVLAITSAGDNILAYAAHQHGLTLHCVDMNPCQNHLLELKLACLHSLDYSRFWQMFGTGRCSDFADTLDREVSGKMSSQAYQFWRSNVGTFAPGSSAIASWVLGDLAQRNLYTTGYSGTALHCLRLIMKVLGIHLATQQLLTSASVEAQSELWMGKISRRIVGSLVLSLFDNPAAMWQLLGVPINQLKMLHNEGSMSQYVRDTLDPVATRTSFASDNYFYHLLFARQYSRDCCPTYLTKPGFDRLRDAVQNSRSRFYLHTATIVDVLGGMGDSELDKAVLMDHMDWFSQEDAEKEVAGLARVIKKGGFVVWRSAARIPWYIAVFEAHGFDVQALSIREPNTTEPIDRVNMYASFYKAIKQ
ncbi:hypothetical protein LPJ53_001157 [Coemansia erecta]|uniref:Methyltransferase domain-containing protein n=1 Tax=Coemansia erecta TaxID=147472 RepID=A0A9W7Y4V1_9FUNG|nr:hypothetical protein LPJ53_001157 [Coemansia erecta]